ncbi:FkbM family methyltransferase [Mesorhizobium sp. RP14(2022)]|uniref:FkbM family methyltransferase n=1 Tax=Mesorhizobium liriopis TaxID=2953882 RepID=A0ABT1C2S5_9HYPH|nr:FkbM family methyltransferase [Mesorhizobium liriopis]MCO6049121.1 FkbM family methyltransferase [Mesorhizobium liriopis]
MLRRLGRSVRQWKSGFHKLCWGLRTVGPRETLVGAGRLAGLGWKKPARAEVRLRSGFSLEFDYPSQFPTMPVTFGDLVDPEFAFLRKVFRSDWVVIDVGASIGPFSLFCLCLPVGHVHAFEPSAANVRMLARNAARNGVADRITIHKLALGDAPAEAVFETTQETWNSRLALSQDVSGERVSVRRVDDEIDRLGLARVSVLKINVAGYEPTVLMGAEALLKAGRADILIMLLGLPSLPHYARIARFGYRFFFYQPRRGTLHEIVAFDEASVLNHRPWPARHIIAIREGAMEDILARGVAIQPR